MKTYTAVCVRSGGWWAIRVPELKGVHSQTKRLAQVEAMARDAIALFLDVDPNSFAVQVQPELPIEVSEAVQARAAAKTADEHAEHATRRAAVILLEKGYSVRDVGRLLGLSPQRISQITSTAGKAKARNPEIAA